MQRSFFLRIMKKIFIGISCILFLSAQSQAQHRVSFDLAAIRNIHKPINGLNVSCFYYFNKNLTAGFEVNRFFPVKRKIDDEDIKISAWDIELNMHYLFSVYKGLNLYPIAGISHTTDRELNIADGHSRYESFWSFNTGAGVLWEIGKWSPHIEYSFAWGQQNQQFLLAGISYELELGQKNKEK